MDLLYIDNRTSDKRTGFELWLSCTAAVDRWENPKALKRLRSFVMTYEDLCEAPEVNCLFENVNAAPNIIEFWKLNEREMGVRCSKTRQAPDAFGERVMTR